MSDQFTIEFAELPIVMGAAAHNYIVLKDDQGRILREMHGLATGSDGQPKEIGWLSTDKIVVYERSYSLFENPDGARATVFSGSEAQAFALWERAQQAMLLVNEQNIPYSTFGFSIFSDTKNSNAAASTLMAAMGLAEPNLSWKLDPGSGVMLLSAPQLLGIQISKPIPPSGEGSGGGVGADGGPPDANGEVFAPLEIEVATQDYYYLVSTDNGDGSWTKEIFSSDWGYLGGWTEYGPDVKPGLPDNPTPGSHRMAATSEEILPAKHAEALIASMSAFGAQAELAVATQGRVPSQMLFNEQLAVAI